LPYTLFLIRETINLNPGETAALGWAIYGSMTIVALYILKSAILFHRFSKVFGFADNKR